jgi:hypothetical protein
MHLRHASRGVLYAVVLRGAMPSTSVAVESDDPVDHDWRRPGQQTGNATT